MLVLDDVLNQKIESFNCSFDNSIVSCNVNVIYNINQIETAIDICVAGRAINEIHIVNKSSQFDISELLVSLLNKYKVSIRIQGFDVANFDCAKLIDVSNIAIYIRYDDYEKQKVIKIKNICDNIEFVISPAYEEKTISFNSTGVFKFGNKYNADQIFAKCYRKITEFNFDDSFDLHNFKKVIFDILNSNDSVVKYYYYYDSDRNNRISFYNNILNLSDCYRFNKADLLEKMDNVWRLNNKICLLIGYSYSHLSMFLDKDNTDHVNIFEELRSIVNSCDDVFGTVVNIDAKVEKWIESFNWANNKKKMQDWNKSYLLNKDHYRKNESKVQITFGDAVVYDVNKDIVHPPVPPVSRNKNVYIIAIIALLIIIALWFW